MQFFVRIIGILLLSSTAFAQTGTLSEADQIKAVVRLKIWQETLNSRILVRADTALLYIDFDGEGIQEGVRNEAGFHEEELRRWIIMKSSEFSESLNADFEPFGEQIEAVKSLDELETLLTKADQLVYERTEEVQSRICKEIGPDRLTKLRRLGLQICSHLSDADLVDFKAYEFLDLTEEQRKRFEVIRNEYTQGVDACFKEAMKIYEQLAAFELKWGKKTEKEIEDNETVIQKEAEKLEKKQAEKGQEIGKKFQGIVKSAKVKISLLLTDEQTKRLEKIIAETPEWLKALKKTEAAPEDDSWKDSWKPGDPVPEDKTTPKQRKAFPLKIM